MKHEHMAAWKPDEDQMILKLYATEGRKWAKIASALPGRTSASVRNRFLRIEKGQQLRSAGLSKNRCAACGQYKLGHVCPVKLADALNKKPGAGGLCMPVPRAEADPVPAPINMNIAYSVPHSLSQSMNATRAPTRSQSPTLRVSVPKMKAFNDDDGSDPALSLLSFACSRNDEYHGSYHPSPRACAAPATANMVPATPVGVAIPAPSRAVNNNMMISLNFPMQMPCAYASLSGATTPFSSYAASAMTTPRCDASTQVEIGDVRMISPRPYVPACPEHRERLPPIAHAAVAVSYA